MPETLRPRPPPAGDDQEEEVTFAEERAFLAGYVELESLRFGDRLVWHEAIQPETLACRVPALSLQPLVENALRYAVAPRAEGGRIDLRTRMREGRLEIDVADDGPATTANSIAVPRASLFHCDSGSSRPALIRSVSFVFTAPT